MEDVSFEAEQALLGALLVEPAAWDLIADIARPEHFGVQAHRALAGLLYGRLAASGKLPPFDAVTVVAELDRLGRQDVPRDLPMSLGRATGITSNARHYADLLRDLWLRRLVKQEARAVLEDAQTPGGELAARFASRLAEVETSRGRRSRPLHDIVMERADFFEEQAKAKKEGREVPLARIPTGLQRLDRLTGGIAIGQATIIGARPGVGKTALESALADNFAARGHGTCIFQLEDYGASIADRAQARRARINTMQMRDASEWNTDTWGRYLNAAERYQRAPIWVDDEHGVTPLDVAGKMRREVREHAVRVFMLDVLAELDVERWAGGGIRFGDDRLDRLLGKAVRFLRDTAYGLNAALLVFLHLNRELERRQDPTPRLSDIKNSGDVEDAAHQVWFLSRPKEPKGTFNVDVAKHRDGPTGVVSLSWLEDYSAVVNPQDLL